MAKSKKSKILASMLAVSTMAVFYAAPVMAGDSNTEPTAGTGITINVKTDGTPGNEGLYVYNVGGNVQAAYKVGGTLNISTSDITTALQGSDLTLNNLTTNTITVDGTTIDLSQFADVDLSNVAGITRSAGATTPGTGTTTIEGVLSVDGTTGEIYNSGSTFGVDAAGNVGAASVTTSGDVSTGRYTLNTVGADLDTVEQRTQKITYVQSADTTNISGKVIASGVTLNNGNISTNGTLVAREVANISGDTLSGVADDVDDLTLSVSGVKKDVTELNHKTQNINTKYTYAGTTTFDGNVLAGGTIGNGRFMATADGMVSGTNFTTTAGADLNAINQRTSGIEKTAADTKVEGVGFYNGRMDADAVVTDKLTVADELTVNGLSNLDGVRVQNGSVYATNASNVGGVQLADGNVTATEVTAGGYKLTDIGKNTQDIHYNDGVTTIGGDTLAVTDEGYVTINNGAFAVGPDGMATVGNNIKLDGETGVVYANDLKATNNVYSKNYNLEEVGADLDDLTGSVGNIGDNVAGITRDAEDGALPGEGTTTIEDTLSVSGDSVLAQVGSSQLVITEDVAGLSSGNASFALSNNELQLSVAGNGLLVNQFGTNLNGTVNFIGHDGNSYTLSDLEGRVYDLEQKTQNITSTDPGQGGSSEVPPTGDGHTGFEGDVTVGGDINADEGNFNKVNTDEINVGDNTFIDGDSVNSNEGNFKDKVTVGSGENQTVINNGGITVGDSEGTSINHDEVRVGGEDGSYMNENDVVTGEGNSLNDTANRVGNLEQGVSELNNRVGELEDRIDKVGAMAAAIANLRTMGYDPAAPTEVAVGIGQYRDETGAALGLFHYPNRDFMLSLSVSTSGDEVMGGIGATWKFGRKSPEKVAEIKKAQAEADARRAEEAKLAKAEEMKQAAKEAKIKAQQERHAKLAAERAAQAEAAK